MAVTQKESIFAVNIRNPKREHNDISVSTVYAIQKLSFKANF